MTNIITPKRNFVPGDDPGDQQPPQPAQASGALLAEHKRTSQPERRSPRSLANHPDSLRVR